MWYCRWNRGSKIVDIDLINRCKALIDFYAVGSEVVELVRHESSYSTATLEKIGPMVNDFITYLNSVKEWWELT